MALFPFFAKGALSLIVLRAMRDRGFFVKVAFYEDASAVYPPDLMNDFVQNGCILDLSQLSEPQRFSLVQSEIRQHNFDVILQLGATDLYHLLPYWKQESPSLRIVDTLYNEYGHTVNHFLYEQAIDGVIVESEYMRDFVERTSAKLRPNIKVLSNGIDLQTFMPAEEKKRERDLIVGYVGRMSAEKNPMGFIDLAEKVCDALPEVNFRMFGSGNQSELVRRRLENSPAQTRITFEGFIDHTPTALHQLDVLVLPSKFDGRPNIIMEASACGVPVIAAPVGGVPELIDEGCNGFLIQPTESDRVCVLLAKWAADSVALDSIKKTSREVALSKFNRTDMLDAYERALIHFGSV
ncbi:glycosyltransferase family 4 protein [Paraburkholderia franconis]|uniref:glycosyltransferase family 4 protein n=1 Tax=Paraburkholderia franconis TaxID=2654983 RepID=UPI001D10ACE3|nr:glycosyltransferase family 4 protein [Paraburkholderia franconis]